MLTLNERECSNQAKQGSSQRSTRSLFGGAAVVGAVAAAASVFPFVLRHVSLDTALWLLLLRQMAAQ